jgi:hypothetical protein
MAVVRSSDGRVLGEVGRDYTIVQNHEALDWFAPFVDSGTASVECVGSLREGSRVFVLAKLNRDPMTVVPGDEVLPYLLNANAHDGSLRLHVGFSAIRVVCANTLQMARTDKRSKVEAAPNGLLGTETGLDLLDLGLLPHLKEVGVPLETKAAALPLPLLVGPTCPVSLAVLARHRPHLPADGSRGSCNEGDVGCSSIRATAWPKAGPRKAKRDPVVGRDPVLASVVARVGFEGMLCSTISNTSLETVHISRSVGVAEGPSVGGGSRATLAVLAAKARMIETLATGDLKVLATELRAGLEALAGERARMRTVAATPTHLRAVR